MIFFLVSLGWLAIIGGIYLWADYSASGNVYGKLLSKRFLDEYFAKHLSEYSYEYILDGILVRNEADRNYIAEHRSLASKYYIKHIGQIPRWSPYTKIIELQLKDHEKTL